MSTRYVREERVSILPILIEFQSDIRLRLDPNCHLDISEYELISIYLLSFLVISDCTRDTGWNLNENRSILTLSSMTYLVDKRY